MTLDTDVLIQEATYDAVRAVVTKIDQNGNILAYAFDPLIIEVEGGIDLIGPDVISLQGGAAGFWIKTNGKAPSAS